MDYRIEDKTRVALSFLDKEMDTIHPSRKFIETRKALISNRPERYIDELSKMGLLSKIMPEVENLKGLEQNEIFHPEGDTFEHTKQVMLVASILTKEMFPGDNERLEKNVLGGGLHDVGKKVTQTFNEEKNTFQYIKHETEGVPLVKERVKEWNIESWSEQLTTVTAKHMYMHNDLNKVNLNKVIGFLLGTLTRKTLNDEQKEDIKKRIVTTEELKGCENIEQILTMLETKEKYNKTNKLRPKLMLKFSEQLKDKKVTLLEFQEHQNSYDFLLDKTISEKELDKWTFIEKEKGLLDKMDLEDFIILCASDGLGRLKIQKEIIYKEAANILSDTKLNMNKINDWKNRNDLEEKYTNDFVNIIKNKELFKIIIQKEKEITPNIDVSMLRELGKKEDEIAFLKYESKRRNINKSIKDEMKLSL
jgi:putative nucleotidyltransferase with HDIG domain